MTYKLQQLKAETKIKFYQNISNHYNEMKIRKQSDIFQFEEDLYSKKAEGIKNFFHEVLLLMKFLQTKPQNNNTNINYYDFYYSVIKNRDDKEIVNDEYENNEIDYNKFDDLNSPNSYIGSKNENIILKSRKLRSQINHFN